MFQCFWIKFADIIRVDGKGWNCKRADKREEFGSGESNFIMSLTLFAYHFICFKLYF